MTNQWIVVSDAAKARIFSRNPGDGKLRPIQTLVHDESRAHEGDLRTGGKGDIHDSGGHGQRQPDPQTTTMEKHADIFAKKLVDWLKRGLNAGVFKSLVVTADPSFLGLIREQMDTPLHNAVTQTIDKNWAQHGTAQIEKQLNNHL